MEHGVPIRSISRCIAVLQAIDRGGPLTLVEIARASGLADSTAVRTIQTLIHEGLVECEPDRMRYRSTSLVHTLAQGFRNHDRMVSAARRHIAALTRRVGWPVSITTRAGRMMMLRDSTHALTSLTFDLYAPGFVMPLLECAAGLAYLAHADDDERDRILESIDRSECEEAIARHATTGLLRRIREDGYATYECSPFMHSPGKTSAIAVPLFDHGRLAGVLELVYFVTSMTVEESLVRNLAHLQHAARAIAASLAALPLPSEPPSAGEASTPEAPSTAETPSRVVAQATPAPESARVVVSG